MIRFLQTPGPIKKVILSGILLVFCGAMVITLIPGGLGSNFGFGAPAAGVVAYVAGQEVTVIEVEKLEEDCILARKLGALINGSVSVTDSELRHEFERRNTKVKFEYAALSQDEIRKAIHPTDAELKAFYERNKATYANSIPEKRKVKFVLIDTAKLEAQAAITPQELQAYYNQHLDDYRVPEQVKGSHILIKT